MEFIEKTYIFKKGNKYFPYLLDILYDLGGDGLEFFALSKELGEDLGLFIEPEKVKKIYIKTDSYIVDELEISNLGINEICIETEDNKSECINMFQKEFSYRLSNDEYIYMEDTENIYIKFEEVFNNRIGEIEKYPNPGCCLEYILAKGADKINEENYELEDDDE